jgi:nucleoside-diphosphate-sugar epimerase
LKTASIRLPGIVGAGSRNNFLSDVGRKILRGEIVHAKNPSARFNNIVHVRALSACIEALLENLSPGHTVLTLGASEPMTIREVLGRLFRQCGRAERLEFAAAEGPSFLIEFEAARALGYRPQTVRASLDAFAADLVAGDATV